MKKALLFVGLFVAGISHAQDCSKIFISEYVEGWSNNKALEIYNPTASTVDLSQYFVSRFDNGSQNATLLNSVQLSGSIAPFSVYVAALDQRDPAGTGQTAPLWDSLIARADGFYSPNYTDNKTFYWNGNDAVVLFKGILPTDQPLSFNIMNVPNVQPIDRVGRVGENPGPQTGWSTGAPYNNGNGVIVTVDHSLIRKASVKSGDVNASAVFNPLTEWDSIPATTIVLNVNGDTIKSNAGNPIKFGNWFSLGSHDCDCNVASVKNIAKNVEMNIFPNPSTEGVFKVQGNSVINEIKVYNSLGQMIVDTKVKNIHATVNVGNTSGVYIMKIETPEGITTKKVIVK